MRLGIDVDGVLADFNDGFMELTALVTGEDHYGMPRPPITTWNYNTDQFGYTKEQDRAAWAAVKASPSFWHSLCVYDHAVDVLHRLKELESEDHDIYFITSRVGVNPKMQTYDWLDAGGFPEATVLISSEKGLCAMALNLDLYVDDKNENCMDVQTVAPKSQVLMIEQPWNRDLGLPRIELRRFLDILKEIR